jgi:hypothetical protein
MSAVATNAKIVSRNMCSHFSLITPGQINRSKGKTFRDLPCAAADHSRNAKNPPG